MNDNDVIENKKVIVRTFIRNHPGCSYLDIRNHTKIKVERIYRNMIEAYHDAGVNLSKNLIKRSSEQQRKDVIEFIRENQNCGIPDIRKNARVNVIRVFGGIIQAYREADIKYPLRQHKEGVVNPLVVKRSLKFEKKIISLLKNYGKVRPKVRTSAGIVDCLFKYKNTNYVVEIKDFRSERNITMSQIKQLVKYMKALNYKNGLLICPPERFPKRKNKNNICIEDLKIEIISENEIVKL